MTSSEGGKPSCVKAMRDVIICCSNYTLQTSPNNTGCTVFLVYPALKKLLTQYLTSPRRVSPIKAYWLISVWLSAMTTMIRCGQIRLAQLHWVYSFSPYSKWCNHVSVASCPCLQVYWKFVIVRIMHSHAPESRVDSKKICSHVNCCNMRSHLMSSLEEGVSWFLSYNYTKLLGKG